MLEPRNLLRVKFRASIPLAHRMLLVTLHVHVRPCYEARKVMPVRVQTAVMCLRQRELDPALKEPDDRYQDDYGKDMCFWCLFERSGLSDRESVFKGPTKYCSNANCEGKFASC